MRKRSLVVIAALVVGTVAVATIVLVRTPGVAPPQVEEHVAAPPSAVPGDTPSPSAATPPEPPGAGTPSREVPAHLPEATAAKPKPPARDRAPGRSQPELTVAVLWSDGKLGDAALNDAVGHGLDLARRHGVLRIIERHPGRELDASLIDGVAHERPALVIAVGARHADAVRAASGRHPSLRFLLLDGDVPGVETVRSVVFRGDEGAFLAGVAAAAETQRGTVGMIGGMSTPAHEAFECAWETGVRWGTKEAFRLVRGVVLYLGTTAEAFAQPAEAEERSRELIENKGVDVIVAAAGGSGAGVLAAARRARIKAIAVDPGADAPARDVTVATIRKRADRIVETAVSDIRRGAFRGGASVMNLANAGVEVAPGGSLAPATRKLLERARSGIVTGRVDVCVREEERPPAWNFPPRPQG